MNSTITIETEGSRKIASIHGDLNVFTYKQIREPILDGIKSGDLEWIVDLANVNVVDSSGMAVLASINSSLKKKAGSLEIKNTPDAVYKMFQLTGLENVLSFS